MKIKTSELTGVALDWAVAKCEGKGIDLIGVKNHSDPNKVWINATKDYYKFSTNWAVGGPIIECENITIKRVFGCDVNWHALTPETYDMQNSYEFGETPLEAAMRAYVSSKLGDEIEIPKELT